MAPEASTANTGDLSPDPVGYQVDDLIIDLPPRRVRRAETLIPLKGLSFDLLVTLARAAPELVSFDELSERVWPGLVITPETIVQRVKLVRGALGDDPQAPRYIEGKRGRGYRMVAEVRPLTETKKEERPSVGAGMVPAPRRPARRVSLGWIGGMLAAVMLLAGSWTIVHHRETSRPAEQSSLGTAPEIHSLAVLPLENLSGDQEQEYFADGMTDALTTDLAQVSSLRVISRTSAMHFKGSNETLPQIGRALQVDAVVEGTVTRGENRVRVTAQLVEASTDQHLWARTYERDLKNILALQDEIAQDVANQIRVKLTPKERSLLMQVHAVDPEAYDDTLRGWYWWNQFTPEGVSKALNYFQNAVAKDPSYAMAYAGLADSFFMLGFGGDKEAISKAREAAVKALALDPSLVEAHTALANIKFFEDWDWSGAEAEYKQATELNLNSATAHHNYSTYLVAMGRLDEAMKEIERARDVDPFSPFTTWWQGQVLYHARRYDDALRANQLGLEMHPDNAVFYLAMGDVYEQKKMFAEAFAARQQALKLSKDPNATAFGEAYKRSGYSGYLLKQAETLGAENLAYTAHIYALLKDEPRAMTALEAAYSKRNSCVLFMRTAPELDSIRSSPRFQELVRRVGLPQPPDAKN